MAKVDIDIIAHDKASGVLNGIKGAFGGIATIAGGILTSGLIENALSGIVDFGKSVVSEAAGAEEGMAQLEAVLKSTGGAAGVTADMASKLADQMLNLTRFDDEAAISAQTVLLQFTKIGKEAFPQALDLTADLATRMGTDLTSAAQLVGRALGDPAEGIGRMNTAFRLFEDTELDAIKAMAEAGDVAGAQAIIMDRLAEKVGGAATAAGQTFSGQMDILKNQLNNVKEAIGVKLLPILSRFVEKITEWLGAGGADKIAEWAGKIVGWIGAAVDALGNLGGWWETFGPGIISRAQSLWESISRGVADLTAKIAPFVSDVLGKISAWFIENRPALEEFAALMMRAFQALIPVVVAVWDVISPLLLGIIEVVLQLATAVLSIATGDWAGAWEAIKGVVVAAGEAIWNAIVGFLNLIAVAMGGSLEQIGAQWRSNWEQLKQIVTSVFTIIGNFIQQKIDGVRRAFDNVVSAISNVIAWLGRLKDSFFNIKLPSWLTPGSPTPFEIGLKGINAEMAKLSSMAALPAFTMPALAPVGVPASAPTNRQTNITINATVRSQADLDYLAQEITRRQAR